MMDSGNQHEVAAATAKVMPPIAVSGGTITGILEQVPLHEILIVLTIIYTGVQLYILVRDKILKSHKRTRK
jgi:hypothetical protein